MSSLAIIRDLNEVLKKMASDHIEGLNENDIVFNSPGEIDNATTTRRLSIFLYQITHNPHLRNIEGEYVNNLKKPIPLAVDLNYLFIPYAGNRQEELIMTEDILQMFHDKPTLLENDLTENIVQSGNKEIHVIPVVLSLDDLNKLWGTFRDKPFKLTLSYTISPVLIPSELDSKFVKPPSKVTLIAKDKLIKGAKGERIDKNYT